MSGEADGREDRVVRVLVMGTDMRAERALLSRLRATARLHDGALVSCDDPVTCDLMVVRDTSAMRNVARRMATGRAAMRLWILDEAGGLSDGTASSHRAIGDADVRAALRAIGGGTAPGLQEPTDAGAVPLARAFRDRVHQAGGHAALTLDGAPRLLLDFGRRIAVEASQHDNAAPVLARRFDDLRLQDMAADRFIARTRDLPALPLVPLLWNLALHAGRQARLLPPLHADTVLVLRQWPDFRALAHRHDQFRLCSLLLKRPSTASEAGALLELDAETVHGFFNAAYLSGYAAIDLPRADVPARPPLPSTGTGSTLARMWRNVRERLRA